MAMFSKILGLRKPRLKKTTTNGVVTHELTFKDAFTEDLRTATYYRCSCGRSQGWVEGDRSVARGINEAVHRTKETPPTDI